MSLRERLRFRRRRRRTRAARLAELGRVHVLAIGGAGMSAVARLLLDAVG
jgi:UDP-N-acetylmuramate--alanine ligase